MRGRDDIRDSTYGDLVEISGRDNMRDSSTSFYHA